MNNPCTPEQPAQPVQSASPVTCTQVSHHEQSMYTWTASTTRAETASPVTCTQVSHHEQSMYAWTANTTCAKSASPVTCTQVSHHEQSLYNWAASITCLCADRCERDCGYISLLNGRPEQRRNHNTGSINHYPVGVRPKQRKLLHHHLRDNDPRKRE